MHITERSLLFYCNSNYASIRRICVALGLSLCGKSKGSIAALTFALPLEPMFAG
jgi:hypothetical protein